METVKWGQDAPLSTKVFGVVGMVVVIETHLAVR